MLASRLLHTQVTVLAFILYACIFLTADMFTTDDCRRWSIEGECIKNPRFMWTNCLEYCVQNSKDDNNLCLQWATSGECAANPKYVQLHCPESCGYAAAWNPFTRAQLTIDNGEYVTISEDQPLCENEIFEAGRIIHNRLNNIFQRGSYNGMSKHTPSEFLLTYGLSETFLYALRLYHLVLGPSADFNELYQKEQRLESLMNFNTDDMSRAFPEFRRILNDSANMIPTTPNSNLKHQCPFSPEKGVLESIAEKYNPQIQLLNKIVYDNGIQEVETSGAMQDEKEISVAIDREKIIRSPKLLLSNGVYMPALGLGTWQLVESECEEAVYAAIAMGYRHIDTAQAYGNENEVGRAIERAINEKLVTREELFITTKLSFDGDVVSAVEEQLRALRVDYIDLYMLHSPLTPINKLEMAWEVLENFYDRGVIRALGLSNHDSRELQRVLSIPSLRHRPVVIQNKFDIYHPGKQLDDVGDKILATCVSNNITMVAYSPFSSFPFVLKPLDDPIINILAKRLNLKPSTVLLQWSLQQGVAVIPRTSSVAKLKENLEAASSQTLLPSYAMKIISSISKILSNRLSVAE
jgi:diketogulonate reductase-like aldo/keto reductase